MGEGSDRIELHGATACWERYPDGVLAPLSSGYRRREPEKTLLYEVVEQNLPPHDVIDGRRRCDPPRHRREHRSRNSSRSLVRRCRDHAGRQRSPRRGTGLDCRVRAGQRGISREAD